MRGRTFALSQKELQRVSVISSCVKGDMACARAAELLSLSIRQVKRLKRRFREQGEAAGRTPTAGDPALAVCPPGNASRSCGWPAPPMPVSTTTISAKNFARSRASPSAAKPCAVCCGRPASVLHANAVLPLIANAVCDPLAKANWCNSTVPLTTGWKAAARVSPRSACRTTPQENSWPLSSFLPNPHMAISPCCASCSAATARRSPSMAITAASSCATMISGPWKNNSPANGSPLSSAALSPNSVSLSSPPAAHKPKAASNVSGAYLQDRLCSELRLAQACDRIPPTPSCAFSWPTTTAASPAVRASRMRSPHGVQPRKIWTASAASFNQRVVRQRQHRAVGRPAFPESPNKADASALPEPKSPHLSSARRTRLAVLWRNTRLQHTLGFARVTLLHVAVRVTKSRCYNRVMGFLASAYSARCSRRSLR